MKSEDPEAPPSEDVHDYWPDNIFIPKSMLDIFPPEPWLRDSIFMVICFGACALVGYWLSWLNEYVGAVVIALPMILICNLSLSLNRAFFGKGKAWYRYLERKNNNGKNHE